MRRDQYMISNGELKRKDNTLYFYNADGKKQSLPVEQLKDIHIFGEVDFNTKLLNYLSQYDICLHIYNYYGYYAGTYYPREKNVSGLTIVKQSEHYLDQDKRLYLAQQFVESAFHHILRNLRRYKEKIPQAINFIESERKKMDKTEKIQELMGLEGNIRQYYYESFGDILNRKFVINKREKQPPTDPLNAMISFGNQLTYRAVLSEIYRTQLTPTVSFLHEPSTKRFSLSLDLGEIFKPLLVDTIIFSLVNRNSIGEKHFDYLEKEVCFLNDEGKKKFISAWEEKLSQTVKHRTLKRNTSYRYLIRLECYKLIKHFIGDEIYKPLKAWW